MNSFDKVHRGIVRMLYEGRLLPGQRLVAPTLAREFEASRNTIREVLNRLCSAGLISMVRNRSPTVRVLSRAQMTGLLEVVGALLSLAARTAATLLGNDEKRALLEQAYRDIQTSETERDLGNFVHARERYYRALLQISGNEELIRLFPTLHVHLMRLQLRSIPLVAQSAQFSDYAAINDAVMRRKPREAAEAAEDHVQHMIQAIRAMPDAMFAEAGEGGAGSGLVREAASNHPTV